MSRHNGRHLLPLSQQLHTTVCKPTARPKKHYRALGATVINMSLPPIYKRTSAPDPLNPFVPDIFNRRPVAEKLTQLLERLPEGAVFAIDAPWGEGKTWFGRNWHHKLIADDYHSVYIDTFAYDYIDDPFVMLSGEISAEFIRKGNPKGIAIKDAGKQLLKAILPMTAKILINTVGRVALGSNDISEDLSDAASKGIDSIADKVEKTIDQCIDSFEHAKGTVQHFHAALELAAKDLYARTGKPLVIFLDELDRCKPDYAVKTIERIKHFFDTPHLIFVLLLNKRQLHESVRGVYGQGINAELYLEKFIQFTLNLPKPSRANVQGPHYIYFIERMVAYGWQPDSKLAEALETFAKAFSFSLRSIEQCVILLSMAAPTKSPAPLSAWIAALKVGDSKTFHGIITGELGAHDNALTYLDQIPWSDYTWINEMLAALKEFHGKTESSSQMSPESIERFSHILGSNSMHVQDDVINYFRRFDLSIDF